eukprot:TRINITY_DN4566_c0_g1_i8.p1 TRINITY_DN4566_c0_g1~~TRINITY_DN4566_c0_g1_i8.p1  ORF type:complete len:776 (-),score=87.70 TRINITY_DN4566_c0_g1_i8:139-2466(-)
MEMRGVCDGREGQGFSLSCPWLCFHGHSIIVLARARWMPHRDIKTYVGVFSDDVNLSLHLKKPRILFSFILFAFACAEFAGGVLLLDDVMCALKSCVRPWLLVFVGHFVLGRPFQELVLPACFWGLASVMCTLSSFSDIRYFRVIGFTTIILFYAGIICTMFCSASRFQKVARRAAAPSQQVRFMIVGLLWVQWTLHFFVISACFVDPADCSSLRVIGSVTDAPFLTLIRLLLFVAQQADIDAASAMVLFEHDVTRCTVQTLLGKKVDHIFLCDLDEDNGCVIASPSFSREAPSLQAVVGRIIVGAPLKELLESKTDEANFESVLKKHLEMVHTRRAMALISGNWTTTRQVPEQILTSRVTLSLRHGSGSNLVEFGMSLLGFNRTGGSPPTGNFRTLVVSISSLPRSLNEGQTGGHEEASSSGGGCSAAMSLDYTDSTESEKLMLTVGTQTEAPTEVTRQDQASQSPDHFASLCKRCLRPPLPPVRRRGGMPSICQGVGRTAGAVTTGSRDGREELGGSDSMVSVTSISSDSSDGATLFHESAARVPTLDEVEGMWKLEGSINQRHQYLEIHHSFAISWSRRRSHLEDRNERMYLEGSPLTVKGDSLYRVRKSGKVAGYTRKPSPFASPSSIEPVTSTESEARSLQPEAEPVTSTEDVGSLSACDGYWVPCSNIQATEFHTLEIKANLVSIWKASHIKLHDEAGFLSMEDCRLYLQQDDLLWRISRFRDQSCYRRLPDAGTGAQTSQVVGKCGQRVQRAPSSATRGGRMSRPNRG